MQSEHRGLRLPLAAVATDVGAAVPAVAAAVASDAVRRHEAIQVLQEEAGPRQVPQQHEGAAQVPAHVRHLRRDGVRRGQEEPEGLRPAREAVRADDDQRREGAGEVREDVRGRERGVSSELGMRESEKVAKCAHLGDEAASRLSPKDSPRCHEGGA